MVATEPLIHQTGPRAAMMKMKQAKEVSELSDLPHYEDVLTKPGSALEAKSEWLKSRCAVLAIDKGTRHMQIVCTRDFLDDRTRGFLAVNAKFEGREWKIGVPLVAQMAIINTLNQSTNIDEKVTTEDTSRTEVQFDQIAQKAYRMNATDIHLEVRRNEAFLYFRVFKQVQKIDEMTRQEAELLVRSMYQSLSESDSRTEEFNAKKRQKCVIERRIDGILLRFRYQHAPVAPSGYDAVLRILPIGVKEQRPKSFPELGYSKAHSEEIEVMFAKPEGVTIVAGVTGSGKSTTLQHAIGQLIQRKPHQKVRTVEDPVEYVIWGASQTPVSTSDKSQNADGTNLDFEQTISAIMRMDPDVIMIGEVRDIASASLLVKAVQSGHQVVTTVHASSAIDIIPRLANLGVARDVLGSPNFLAGLIYQKLVPTLCENCKEQYSFGDPLPLHKGLEERINLVAMPNDALFVRGQGCSKCDKRGISGMSVCAEAVIPDDVMLENFVRGQDINAMRHWRKQYRPHEGRESMAGARALDHALMKMREGIVSPVDVEDAFGYFRAEKTEREVQRSGR